MHQTCDFDGGEMGIRTPAGCDPTAGFQDQSLQPLGYFSVPWWTMMGLNHRPHPYKGCALTAALMVRKKRRMYYTDNFPP